MLNDRTKRLRGRKEANGHNRKQQQKSSHFASHHSVRDQGTKQRKRLSQVVNYI